MGDHPSYYLPADEHHTHDDHDDQLAVVLRVVYLLGDPVEVLIALSFFHCL